MGDRIDKTQLVNRIASRLSKDPGELEPVADAVLEEIYEAMKREESVSLRNFGTFYMNWTRLNLTHALIGQSKLSNLGLRRL